MIDRCSRTKVIGVARQYVAGLIDSDSFDEIIFYDITTEDVGLKKVIDQLWQYYDDLSTHTNSGKHRISDEARGDLARCILFLQADLEYQWPEYILEKGPLRFLSYVFTLGLLPCYADKRYRNSGPFEIWPFFSEEYYQKQLKSPKYLNAHNPLYR